MFIIEKFLPKKKIYNALLMMSGVATTGLKATRPNAPLRNNAELEEAKMI